MKWGCLEWGIFLLFVAAVIAGACFWVALAIGVHK